MWPFKKRVSVRKKEEIWEYLCSLGGNKSVFDQLLSDCMDGTMKDILTSYSFRHLEIHLDWNEKIKRIGIKGRYRYCNTNIDIEIYPDKFTVAYGADEPGVGTTYPLVSRDQVYYSLENLVKLIHRN